MKLYIYQKSSFPLFSHSLSVIHIFYRVCIRVYIYKFDANLWHFQCSQNGKCSRVTSHLEAGLYGTVFF